MPGLGPIFAVDIVTSARRPRYFLLRVLYGLVLLSFLWMTYYQAFQLQYRNQSAVQQGAEFAQGFFISFSAIQIIAVLIVGPAMSAAAIASEREHRTIEYLFATDLTNSEIILSKLASRLLHIGSLIIVGLPVLSIAMLMGGISPMRLLMSFVITLSTMVSVATLGMAVSITSPRVRDAIGRIYVILFALLILPTVVVQSLLSGMQYSWRGSPPWWLGLLSQLNRPLVEANPINALFNAVVAPMYGGGSMPDRWEPVLTMVSYQAVFSALLAAFSLWGVRRIHLASVSKAPSKGKFRFRLLPRHGIGNFPMIWKESRASETSGSWGIVGRIALALILGVVLALVAWLFFAGDHDAFRSMAVAMSTLLACGGLLVTGARAASSITSERERDTWITLLSTPIESGEIISSKILGSIWAFRSGMIPLAIIWLLQILYDPLALLSVVLSAGTLSILLVFASSLGTLYSLSLRTSVRSISATLGTMLGVGGGYLMCCGPVMFIGRGGELILAGCVPFLLAFPGIVSIRGEAAPPGEMVGAFLFGNLGYAVGAFFLWQVAISNLHRGGTTDGAATSRPGTSTTA